ncbi:hypothetical protein Plo01_68110 [Planobispora longispora]|uniref:Uncharacterized protein n=1 Tax=Planobispora longispora TaxID=28887 RepID=A0A8J3RUZ3_9ACTN|nr:hypothetical protein Plo01_68110 [Planobispora longispora]
MRGQVGHIELRAGGGGDAEQIVEKVVVIGDGQGTVQGCLPETWGAPTSRGDRLDRGPEPRSVDNGASRLRLGKTPGPVRENARFRLRNPYKAPA